MITFEKFQQVKEIKYYKMIAIDLSKLQALDSDPKDIQKIHFTGNLNKTEGVTIFSLLKKQNKPF